MLLVWVRLAVGFAVLEDGLRVEGDEGLIVLGGTGGKHEEAVCLLACRTGG